MIMRLITKKQTNDGNEMSKITEEVNKQHICALIYFQLHYCTA